MTDHAKVLAERAAAYRGAQDQLAVEREALQKAVREASGDGMKQAEIIRATDHVWTREQVRQVLLVKE
ncbi:hypothetical protein PV646_34075 [Streptomyces sp. ID05-26A]|nr:hypothetical protein [Streptomyces sp. ID05-26A]